MRTDHKIKQEVSRELEWEPNIDSAGIGVAVRDGVVTLSGQVGTFYEKLLAEKAVSKVKGVRAVVENIKTELSQRNIRSDESIAEAALNHLKSHSQIPSEKLNLKVEGGYITLDGEVEWSFQKKAAQNAIQYLKGVTGITNNIKIIPGSQPEDLRKKIKDAFERNALLDADHLKIKIEDHTIFLSGYVSSWIEKNQAEKLALFSPGITSVENNIQIRMP